MTPVENPPCQASQWLKENKARLYDDATLDRAYLALKNACVSSTPTDTGRAYLFADGSAVVSNPMTCSVQSIPFYELSIALAEAKKGIKQADAISLVSRLRKSLEALQTNAN